MKIVKKESVLRKTLPFLRVVSNLSPNSRKKILKELNGDKDIYKSMREIAVNTLNGNIPLNVKNRKLLKKHKKTLYALNKTKTNGCSCKKRKYLMQQGSGFLPFLIPIVATIISKVFEKRNE